MGNYRFKLSDMMPNAWFYKLKDNMGGRTTRNQTSSSTTTKKKQPSSQQNSTTTTTTHSSKPKCNPRKSYYFTRELLNHTSPPNNNLNISETNFPQQPRKSSKQKPKKKKTSFSSSSPVYSSEEETEFPDPEIRTDRVLLHTVKFDEKISTCSGCNNLQNNNNDIIINVDNNSLAKKDDVFDSFSKLMMLPPIVTKPEKFNDFLNDNAKKKEIKKGSLKVKIVNSEQRKNNNNNRRFSVNSPGVKLKINSPRIGIGSRKVQLQLHGRKTVTGTGGYRKSLSDSLAIVKSSVNPERDFRESMVEMIVQNNIRSSKDLEDLLACYLSLNSDEYHDVIIQVFKQIWFDLTDNQ